MDTANLNNIQKDDLLLAYHYFLNNEHTAKISSGINPSTLQTNIVIDKVGKSPMIFTYYFWTYFTDNICSETEIENMNFMLSNEEWKKLHEIKDFITSYSYSHYICEPYVKDYVHKYFEKCNQLNVCKLSTNDFFLPNYTALFNFSKLFVEIPLFCKNIK